MSLDIFDIERPIGRLVDKDEKHHHLTRVELVCTLSLVALLLAIGWLSVAE